MTKTNTARDPKRRFAAYELGHPELDEQHESIYDQLVAIRDSVPPDRSPAALLAVLRSMILHFKYEEQVMDDVGFDYIENHKRVHQQVCWEFAEIVLFATKETVDQLINDHLKHIEYHDRLVVTWWKVHQHRRSTDPK